MNWIKKGLGSTFLAAMFASQTGFAGVGSSGGGFAIVCRSSSGSIESAQILDLFEGRQRGLELRDSASDLESEYKLYLKSLRIAADDAREVSEFDLAQFRSDLATYFNFFPAGVDIGTTNDLGEISAVVPSGCAIEQVAIYHDEAQRIDVKSELWNALDAQNKIALVAHESLYYTYRQAGEKTSQVVRRLTPFFFQKNAPESQTLNVPDNAQSCYATNLNAGAKFDSHFNFFPGANNSTIFQFDNLLGSYTLFPTRVEVALKVEADKLRLASSKAGAFLRVNDRNANAIVSGKIQDGPYSGYSVMVHYQYDRPFTISLVNPTGHLVNLHTATNCHERQVQHSVDSSGAELTELSVRVTRDFSFGWIQPNQSASCTRSHLETMLIQVRGEPNRSFSFAPLGNPKLKSTSTNDDEDPNALIAITSITLDPTSTATLDANGRAAVEITACRGATSAQQIPGWYSMGSSFNVMFQYID